jgi:uncharacterized protein YdiU (UPF0061 family)
LNSAPTKNGHWNFVDSYRKLPSKFYQPALPTTSQSPELLILNEELARSLGLNIELLKSDLGVANLSGNELPTDSTPIALAYAGHQFGNFTILGDGRAILLGEHQTPSGDVFDIQFKGSGPTPYSRGGDGFATLKAMLKEYLYSEAMHGLAIPTTRSLALVKSKDVVRRERLHPRAIVTRVASSHLRVGSFEFARRQDLPTLQALADYAIDRHYPDLINQNDRYSMLLQSVMARQAKLVAQWMSVGFIHGVLNTDNVSISGETIDFGPCAFMDDYSIDTVFSSIDHHGRYAYGNQPNITLWNLCRFAECLIPLIDPKDPDLAVKKAEEILGEFLGLYQSYWNEMFSKKIGFSEPTEKSISLVKSLLELMAQEGLDFTHTFSQLGLDQSNIPQLNTWIQTWSTELKNSGIDVTSAKTLMLAVNPVVIPRNHIIDSLIDEVELTHSFDAFNEVLRVLRHPYETKLNQHPLASPRPKGIPPSITYCGT